MVSSGTVTLDDLSLSGEPSLTCISFGVGRGPGGRFLTADEVAELPLDSTLFYSAASPP
jgi:hypothetical protein